MFKAGIWLMVPGLMSLVGNAAVISGNVSLKGPSIPATKHFVPQDYLHRVGTNVSTTHRPIVESLDGLSEALVYVKRGLDGKSFPMPDEPARLYVEEFQLKPRLLVVRAGQEIRYTYGAGNAGAIVSYFTREDEERKKIWLSAEKPVVKHVFDSAELFVRHQTPELPWMEAHVCVMDHPFFVVTDRSGNFELPAGFPPGNYTIAARHAYTDEQVKTITVEAGKPIELSFELKVEIHGAVNRLSGAEGIRKQLDLLRIAGFQVEDCNLSELFEKLDAAFRRADPLARTIPVMLDSRAVPPPGSPRLHAVEFKPFAMPGEVSGSELLRLLMANARSPITNEIRDDGIRFSFPETEIAPKCDLESLDRSGLVAAKEQLAAMLEQQRAVLAPDHPAVMRLKQRLSRVGSRLSELDAPVDPDPIVNLHFHDNPSAFQSTVLSLASQPAPERTVYPEGIDSSLSSYYPGAKRQYHWAIRDSLAEAGVEFTNGLPKVFHNTMTGRLTVRARTSQAERLRLWVGSIQARAPRILLESKWVELPADTAPVNLPDKPVARREFNALLADVLSRKGAYVLEVPRVVNVAPRRGRLDASAETEIAPARKIKTGPTLSFLNLVDATLEDIHLEMEARLVSFVGHAASKSRDSQGDRDRLSPITREITLSRKVTIPD